MNLVNRIADDITKPDKILEYPDLNQVFDFDCGANALQSVLVYYGGTVREQKVMEKAKTDEDDGTSVDGLKKAIKFYGLKFEDGEMSIGKIKEYIDKGIPVLMSIQAYNGKRPDTFKGKKDHSHWVVAIGYKGDALIFEDPMAPFRVTVEKNDLLDRWYDYNDSPHFYGIAVFGKEPAFEKDKIVPLGKYEVESEGRMEMLKKGGLLSRIASKIMMAMDFPNKKELDKYLKDHPAADKASHKVVEKSKETKKEEVPVSRRQVKKEEPDRDKNPALVEDEGDKSGVKYQTRSDNPEDYTAKMTKIDPKNAIRRVTVGQDEKGRNVYKWLQHGRPISKEQMAQVEKLAGGKAFSPGYEHVHVNDDPKAPLQAYMVDGKGIVQRQYSAEHDEKQAKIKFGRISHFNGDIHGMRDAVVRDQRQGKPAAFLLDLMDKTGFRVGDDKDTGAEKKAYGITALQGRHVRVEGEKIRFLFTAKEGVVVARELMDVNLARFLSERVAKTKPNEKLFPDVSHAKFNDYMKSISPEKRKYSAKDLRTYHGTLIAARVIKAGMPVHSEKERSELVKRACVESSNFLGNTPAMAKKSYIDKHLWSMIQITEGGQKAASITASDEMPNLDEFIETTEFVDEKGKVVELPFEDIEEDDE